MVRNGAAFSGDQDIELIVRDELTALPGRLDRELARLARQRHRHDRGKNFDGNCICNVERRPVTGEHALEDISIEDVVSRYHPKLRDDDL